MKLICSPVECTDYALLTPLLCHCDTRSCFCCKYHCGQDVDCRQRVSMMHWHSTRFKSHQHACSNNHKWLSLVALVGISRGTAPVGGLDYATACDCHV